MQLVSPILIRWIVIYPVDSAIQRLNNRGQMYMIPLTKILGKAKVGYTLDDIKVNHLLFMDGLELFAKNEKLLDKLVSTV